MGTKTDPPADAAQTADKVPAEAMKSIKDASEFLEEHASHPGIADDKTTKSAVMYHAKSLKALCKDMDDESAKDDEEAMTPEDKALAKSMLLRMSEEIEANDRLLKDLAG